MADGLFVFLASDNNAYFSRVFRGDMETEGHGGVILDHYRRGCIVTESDFYKFLTAFDRWHFFKKEERGELFSCKQIEDGILKLDDYPMEYLYVINHSGHKIGLRLPTGLFEIGGQVLVVYQASRPVMNLEMDKRTAVPIARSRFVEILDSLQASHDFAAEFGQLVRRYPQVPGTEYMDGAGSFVPQEDLVIELLQYLLRDKGEMIDYYVHELDFGRKYMPGCVVDEKGQLIDLSGSDQLYHYLAAEFDRGKGRMGLDFPMIDMKMTGMEIRRLMDRKHLRIIDIQNYLGFATFQAVYHWLGGRNLPTVDNLYALSLLFEVPIEDILCRDMRYYRHGNRNTGRRIGAYIKM